MQRFKITKEGYNKLKTDLNRLIGVERIKISKAIGEAIELGDLSENTEYSSSKERQLINEALIATLGEKISNADVIDTDNLSGDSIDFGATVTLFDEDLGKQICYTLLSEFEADPLRHVISVNSPIGNALLGKRIGESAEIRIPGGTKYYMIKNIKWGGENK
ncbi:MAG: transcription elongation factor GreA [Rickettsiales bacterium]|jgi:transcription elongation factor GreA|nr:transcription elongation factor GreA [Rickettsiales bacterium]